ncbi:MAG: hypothetical protein HUK40_22200 [Desulfobacter sp.]|nr:hypothetical protein [Desulfobacter sp.]
MGYGWQGNIRELKNVLERAMILCTGNPITADYLILNRTQETSFETLPLDKLISIIISEHGMNLESLEHHCIVHAMSQTQNNVSKAARILGISRATLRYRLEKLDMAKPDPN